MPNVPVLTQRLCNNTRYSKGRAPQNGASRRHYMHMSACSILLYGAAHVRRDHPSGALPAQLRRSPAHLPAQQSRTHRRRTTFNCLSVNGTELISIDQVTPQEIDDTADLLATAFSESIERANYKRFLKREIKQYLKTSTTELSDDCVIFVAKASEPGSEVARIVGTGMVSFNVKSRSHFITCTPPSSALFLTNMAVSKDYQRKGIASQLLQTCEDYCRENRSERIMCLQVRWKDTPARNLYRKCNYRTMKRDWRVVRLFKEPQELLAKDLKSSESGSWRQSDTTSPGRPKNLSLCEE